MRQIFLILILFYLDNCTRRSWAENSISLNDPMPCKLYELGMDCNDACTKLSANLYGCCRTEMKLRKPCQGRQTCCCNEEKNSAPAGSCQTARGCQGCCCDEPKNTYRYQCACATRDQPGPEEGGEGGVRAGGGDPCCGGTKSPKRPPCCGAARNGYFEQKFKSCYCCQQTEESSSNTNLGTCTILPHQVLSANLEFSEDTFCNSKQNCQPLFIKNIDFEVGEQITACNS